MSVPDAYTAPRMSARDPRSEQRCSCRCKRGMHEGKNGTGRCFGYQDVDNAPPCECRKFRRSRADRLAALAVARADEHPRVAIQLYDASRPRSLKTARARAAGKWGVGPSDVSACRRAVQYRERPPDDLVLNDVDKSAAYLGTMVDEGWKRARRRRYPWRRFSTPSKPFHVTIPGLDVPGEPDEYDPIVGRVTDYKTAGSWSWERIGLHGPFPDMWDQVLVYGLGLEDAGEKVTEVEVIVVNLSGRDNGTSETFRRPYSRPLALAAVGRLHALLDGLDSGGDLPRDREGPSTDRICAKYCPFRDYCWDVPAAEAAGRSPESHVLVHDDADAEAALVRYDEARTAEREAKAAKERERALLDGLEPGPYGAMELGWSGGRKGEYVDDKDAWIAELEAKVAADDPAWLDGRPKPQKWSPGAKPSIRVGRRRQADLDAERAGAAEKAS